MRAVVVGGISHHRTPAHLRERLHLAPDGAVALASSLSGDTCEAVVLATCNRTEIYLAGVAPAEAEKRARHALGDLGGPGILRATVYVHSGEQAARHLFRVTAGLESIVLGDTDVASQVRHAHAAAQNAGTSGPLLDRLFAAASAASKRVRTETLLSTGSTSIPAAALAVAARVLPTLSERRVLVVGAGSVATRAALNARTRGCAEIVVANRSRAAAHELAERVGGRAVSLDDLATELAAADLVLSATGSRGVILTPTHAAALVRSPRAPVAVFDLALPRDVDPSFGDLRGLHLFDLDDLARVVAASGETRRAEVDRADAIVREEAARYESWRRTRAAVPAIAALRDDAEQARRSILDRHSGDLARLAPAERALVETITRQLVAKLLHASTLELRRAA